MLDSLEPIFRSLLSSYEEIGAINHLSGPDLPSRPIIIQIIHDLESLVFPGYTENETLDRSNLPFTLRERISRVARLLSLEIGKSLCFQSTCKPADCKPRAEEVTAELLGGLPALRKEVTKDVDAAFRGDPAAQSYEEVILAYPGVEAIMVHRIAHELWLAEVPLIPRMMSEYIHGKTGIDIHPGAGIGEYFFIDHATGVVIGETTVIGNNVKIYQGVTIGALSVKKDEANVKRHPSIEDDVTIYSGATILGGDTVIGRGAVIGGNVWITKSVPAGSKIYTKPGEYIVKNS